ncbi:DUF2637 domain-containing protein [Paractinoplanes rishiriensis]|uniref:DUF2637 domain-containing protein n=1 Tax=Paractinoplanes rishiriensis TaxID=1050105 RepID=A0A919JUQ7_9ACTN|nr:DUF2637 domain-containing protein [Actinoplanes rishiriensis]GIE93899.1 hypothetical protein Ari01nite_13640 [Actinoplanes rishiriensis]
MIEPRLRRLRWGVRGALVLGVAASVTANVLHALDNPISQAIAAWPPLALLLTVELISRVPIHTRALAFVRLFATAVIAGIAAWVSYWHMAAVAARYGETGASPYLLPLSVDGLIVVASICLVELTARITQAERTDLPNRPAPAPAAREEPADALRHNPPHEALDTSPTAHGVTPAEPTDDLAHDPHDGTDPDHDDQGDETDKKATEADGSPRPAEGNDRTVQLAPDLVPLLPAARAAREELVSAGKTVGRDALAAQLRRNGVPIRNTRASELLAALKAEGTADGYRPKVPV